MAGGEAVMQPADAITVSDEAPQPFVAGPPQAATSAVMTRPMSAMATGR